MVAPCSPGACQDAASATRARRATLTPPRQCTGACHDTTCPDSCRPGVTDRAEPARVQDGTDKQQQQAAAVPHCAAARQSVENPRRSVAVRGGGRGWRTPSRTRTRAANSASRRGCYAVPPAAPTARRGSGRPPYWQRTGDGARGTGAGRRVRVRHGRPLLLGPARTYSAWCWLAGIRNEQGHEG